MKIGIKLIGWCHPIITAEGVSSKKEINIPFNTLFIFKFDIETIRPAIIHIEKADKFASQVSFWKIIGITSIIPAITPKIIPILILLIFFIVLTSLLFC
jgi:hypothetical protein